MNTILRDIGSHTHVKVMDSQNNTVWRPCLFACQDQSYTTAVTTSTFPNMHTFLRGPEFCLMVRKLKSSCQTSKNITLNEQYPGLCPLIYQFPKLCLTAEPVNSLQQDKSRENYQALFNSSRPQDQTEATIEDDSVLTAVFADDVNPKPEAIRLIALLHRYARENLALANIYIKDPAVTLIRRDQKIPVIWFVANVGGILGLCMGCSLVTLFEVLHHILLIFLNTGRKSVNKIQRTIRQQNSPSSLNGHNLQQMMMRSMNGNDNVDKISTGESVLINPIVGVANLIYGSSHK